MASEQTSLSKTTRYLHSIVGLFMITLVAVGYYMKETESWALYPIHKSFGVLIIFLVIPRVIWRLKQGWPTPISPMTAAQHMLSKLVHWTLLLTTILFPVSGILMSGVGGYGVSIFGLELIAANVNPATNEVVPHNEFIAKFTLQIHEILLPVILVALALHIAGAIKHQVMDKDGTITRMFSYK